MVTFARRGIHPVSNVYSLMHIGIYYQTGSYKRYVWDEYLVHYGAGLCLIC